MISVSGIDLFKFYQFKKWYRFIGIYLIGAFSSPALDPLVATVAVIQLFLVQMHSFSMNNYYDNKFWGEENYIREVLGNFDKSLVYAGMFLPLAAALALFPFTGNVTVLLLVYAFLFYLYQGPARLKDNWFTNITINAFCMGSLLFIYPFLAQSASVTPLFVFFSTLFFCYISFFEIVHQYDHYKEEENLTIIEGLGLESSVKISIILVTIIPLFIGLGALQSGLNPIILLVFILFGLFKFIRFIQILNEPEKLLFARESWHKFYSVFEGITYLIALIFII